MDECQNQIRVQAKKVRSKLKRFKKENDARIEADSEVAGSFLDRCARKSLKMGCLLTGLHAQVLHALGWSCTLKGHSQPQGYTRFSFD